MSASRLIAATRASISSTAIPFFSAGDSSVAQIRARLRLRRLHGGGNQPRHYGFLPAGASRVPRDPLEAALFGGAR